MAQARSTGRDIVVTGSTTSNSELTAHPDGGMSLSLNAVAVRKRVNGKWAKLDATLRRNSDGTVSPAVTTAPVTLSGGGGGPFATMDGGAAKLSLSLPMTLPEPQLSGDTAVYAEILPGVDLQVRVTEQGSVSEVLVVKNAQAARNPQLRELRMATNATGMTLSSDADGSLSGRDAFGDVLLHTQPPKMWDSTPVGDVPQVKGRISDGRLARSSAVAPGAAAAVGRIGLRVDRDAITLSPDTAVLTGTRTTYPVYIDPTPVWTPKSYNKTGWASVAETYPSSNYWNDTPDPQGHMQVGNSGSMWAHTLINFPLPALAANSVVNKATLRTREVWSWSCTKSTVNVHAPTAYTLSSSNANWNYWNGKEGSAVDGQPEAHGYSSSCPAADVEFNVLNTVRARLGKTQTFLLAGVNESSDHNSWKEFDKNLTSLNLEYNQPPTTPTSLSTSPSTSCTSLMPVGDADVSLKAVVSDPDGNTVGAQFELWKSPSGSVFYSTPPSTFDFGNGTTAVAVVPKATLEAQAGGAVTKFAWHVRTFDGLAYSPAYSSTCEFNFDPTRAGPPTVSVASNAVVNSPVQVTVTAPTTGTPPASYLYQLNAAAPLPKDAPTGNVTFSVTPTRFTNTIVVTSVTASGNIGDSIAVTFTAQPASPEAVDDLTMDGRADLLTTGRSANGLAPGLWLANATGSAQLDPVAHDIGINGTGAFGTSSPHEYDAAASTATGTFTGGTQNDVLAYYPADTTLQRSGMAVILKGNGDDSTLQTASGFTNTVSPGTFTDLHGQDPIRVANAYNARGAGLAYPDLIAVNGSTDYGHFYLSYYPNSNMVGGYAMGYDIAVNTPDGDQNWQNWDITTTRLPSGTAMYLRNTVTGALRLWTGITVSTNDATYTATIAYTDHSVTGGPGTAGAIQAADIDGNGTADLWSTSAGVTTARLIAAIDDTAHTAALTAQPGTGLITATHAWTLADMGTAGAGDVIGSAADAVGNLNLTGSGAVKWDTGDLFDPDAEFTGSGLGTLATTTAAVDPTASFTLSVWVKPAPTGGYGTVLSQDGTSTAAFKLWADSSDSSWRFAMARTDAANTMWNVAQSAPNTVQPGAWTQLTVTFDATTKVAVLYVNDVNVGAATHPNNWTTTRSFRIGAERTTATAVGGYFTGQIAYAQVWNQVWRKPVPVEHDVNGDGHPDVVAVDSSGILWLYPGSGGTGLSSFGGRIQLTGGATGFRFQVADWNTDGRSDLIGIDPAGEMWYYPSTGLYGTAGLGTRTLIGTGWSTYFHSTGNADNVAHPDHIGVKKSTGELYYYPQGSGKILIGSSGWTDFRVHITDFNHDGRGDVVAIGADGVMWLYPNISSTSLVLGTKSQIGTGWLSYKETPFDFNGDSYQDMVALDTSGNLWVYPRTVSWESRIQIGAAWTGIVSVA
ncbi:LamG-like jellyroll fold domain-containing protein [Catellatospora tritici]|uniref:LamG-like jellyroll fold domain-containing protein n=1 Tax=Catellatospora tritici TaxID=2851566 RepID=UPI001C2DD785|nr:LamG-like jellyroll fold domain-containing protein [Catellatospora tritici]